MTSMPELVAAFHSLVGMAAVLVAAGAFYAPTAFGIGTDGHIHTQSLVEMSLGVAIGAITFTGSVIAFLKLSGRMSGAPIMLPGRHVINLALAAALIFFIYGLVVSQSQMDFWLIAGIAFVFGVLIIIPIGGADMPVVISMLNSYSGWAAAGIGFTLGNSALIITGALVGSSGAILSYIMCKGMNRSFISVILGGFGGEVAAAAGGAEQRPVKLGSAEDAAYIMKNAAKVIIVPGYGMAVAQAQHALREMADHLKKEGVEVKYAIHPVAGRMPGHMNVLLAEANVPYDEVFELEDINSRIRAGRRRLRDRRQRRHQSGRGGRQVLADLRHAGAAGVEGRHRDVHQALAGVRLCRHRQSAVLPRQHHDAARRRQEDDRDHRQGDVSRATASSLRRAVAIHPSEIALEVPVQHLGAERAEMVLVDIVAGPWAPNGQQVSRSQNTSTGSISRTLGNFAAALRSTCHVWRCRSSTSLRLTAQDSCGCPVSCARCRQFSTGCLSSGTGPTISTRRLGPSAVMKSARPSPTIVEKSRPRPLASLQNSLGKTASPAGVSCSL